MCVADFPPHAVHRGETVGVYAGGKKFTVAGKAAPALAMPLSGHPVELAAVSDATGVNAAVLTDALIKEGVCAELTEALSLGCPGLVPTGA